MIKVNTDEATRTLIVEAHGIVSEADIENGLDNLQERYPQVGVRLSGGTKGGIRLFLDWEHLEGWELGAKTAGTMAGKMMSDLVRRVAVVTDAKWQAEKERIADVAKNAKVRFFGLDQRDQAMQWLRED
jgi:hypothetical protein